MRRPWYNRHVATNKNIAVPGLLQRWVRVFIFFDSDSWAFFMLLFLITIWALFLAEPASGFDYVRAPALYFCRHIQLPHSEGGKKQARRTRILTPRTKIVTELPLQQLEAPKRSRITEITNRQLQPQAQTRISKSATKTTVPLCWGSGTERTNREENKSSYELVRMTLAKRRTGLKFSLTTTSFAPITVASLETGPSPRWRLEKGEVRRYWISRRTRTSVNGMLWIDIVVLMRF